MLIVVGSWGSEGTILFAPGPDQPIHRVPQVGGESTAVTEFDEERGDDSHRHPRFLPDGNRFIYLARFPDGAREGQAIVTASLDGGEEKVLARSLAAAEYASEHLLYLRDNTLMARVLWMHGPLWSTGLFTDFAGGGWAQPWYNWANANVLGNGRRNSYRLSGRQGWASRA